MGNRAVVAFVSTTKKYSTLGFEGGDTSPAIYLHWNGGPESIYAFIDEQKRRGHFCDRLYAAARFASVVTEFIGRESGLSVGLMHAPERLRTLENGDINGDDLLEWVNMDPYDNGVFVFNLRGEIALRVIGGQVATQAAL